MRPCIDLCWTHCHTNPLSCMEEKALVVWTNHLVLQLKLVRC